jgi:hypothetical protein
VIRKAEYINTHITDVSEVSNECGLKTLKTEKYKYRTLKI